MLRIPILLIFLILIPGAAYGPLFRWSGSRIAAFVVIIPLTVLSIGLAERLYRWAQDRMFPD